jgi:hypothetical protein
LPEAFTGDRPTSSPARQAIEHPVERPPVSIGTPVIAAAFLTGLPAFLLPLARLLPLLFLTAPLGVATP